MIHRGPTHATPSLTPTQLRRRMPEISPPAISLRIPSRRFGALATFLAGLALFGPAALRGWAPPQAAAAILRGQIIDENGQPVPRVEILLRPKGGESRTLYSDATGKFEPQSFDTNQIVFTLSKPGFFRIENRAIELSPGPNDITLTLNHETELEEKVEVQSQPVQIDPDTTSHQESLVQHEIMNTPVASSHDLQQNLKTMPQVLADSSGRIHVAGGRLGQTEILLDGFEINDPTSGGFTSRMDVDTVRAVTIETGGYGAQYAHASAGIISLDTQSGDDRWRFGTTNFIPGISFQQGTHFGNWYPRATFSGPIRKGKSWFSEAATVQHTFRLLKELPTGQNINSQWSGDSLFRVQVNLTPKNTLLGSFLFDRFTNPQSGLGPFSPLSTTSSIDERRTFVSLKDQILVGGVLFSVGAAYDRGHTSSTPQGNNPYIVTPSMTEGNFFQTVDQKPRRVQFVGDVNTGALNWHGAHTLSAGWNTAGLDFSQQASRHEIDFQRADGTLSETATFSGPAAFQMSNTQMGSYAQDLWRPVRPFVFSIGVRGDWDRLIHRGIVEPRAAMNWVPKDDGRMKLTLAWGKHYQPLSLFLLGQASDEQRSDTFFDPTGKIPLGPPRVSAFRVPAAGLAQARSYNTAAEWDERFSVSTFVGAAFLLRESRDGFAWETQPDNSLVLENNRNDRYVSGEVWVRHSFGENQAFEIDYTRSRASSSEVLDPSLALLILSPQQPGPLLWDAPHRLVSSGWTPIPFWGLFLSGYLEYRTGFPFSVVNEQQQLVGAPNRLRFPNFFNLNLGLEKRFSFRGREWAIRLSEINITGHENPDSVVNNIAAPNFLTFAGGQGRALTVRLRLVTQH